MTDEELAVHLLDLLHDFSPALSIGPGEDDEQVLVEITMSRTPRDDLDRMVAELTKDEPGLRDVLGDA